MATSDHPAGRARHCRLPDCTEPGAARATWVAFPGRPGAFVTLQPMGVPGQGEPVCLDHAHHLVDLMLLRATPEPTR